ncbi:DUF177 domain-containing protein [Flavobacteriaceae bacterium]|nr:DUF177 domain-containing protein [Flavobacteriaceae bacterium]MDB3863136.1 DUF177 domain-containing protein [Flavobacteriaceae bacterium]
MDAIKEFTIPFVGLKDGKHHFEFSIDDTFFAHFEFNDFNRAALKGHLTLDKKVSFLELHFEVNGPVLLPCDVSTELFDYPIDIVFDLIVKFGTPSSNPSDEILVLPEGSYQIDVSQYFYEMVVLALPQKRVHPGIEDGSLKSEIVEKLKALEPKETHLKGSEDPRWNKLKDLL